MSGEMEDCGAVLKLLLIITTCVHLSSSDTHTLQYLYTSNGTFTAVGLVDGEPCVYYDSSIRMMIPKTEWMEKIEDDDSYYWNRETRRMMEQQDKFQDFVYQIKQRFNHTGGDHTLQRMFGCELDDDVITRGYDQYGYDGEDFFSLNLTTGTWRADNDDAESFINDWDPEGTKAEYWKYYLETYCIHQLKNYVSYGREFLERKVLPEVSVFHRHSSPAPEVVYNVTGFFPKPLNITWQKYGETLPNQDGSVQKRIILKVSAEELQKHNNSTPAWFSSLEKELVREVPKGGGSDGAPIDIIIAEVAALVVVVVAGIVVWKKKNSGARRKEADGKFLENGLCIFSTSRYKFMQQTSTDASEGDSYFSNSYTVSV